MTFKHIEGKTPELVEKFGINGWYTNKVQEPLRNSVREFTKSRTMFDMTTNPKMVSELELKVTEEIREFLKKENIPTDLVLATIGKVMPPQAVLFKQAYKSKMFLRKLKE